MPLTAFTRTVLPLESCFSAKEYTFFVFTVDAVAVVVPDAVVVAVAVAVPDTVVVAVAVSVPDAVVVAVVAAVVVAMVVAVVSFDLPATATFSSSTVDSVNVIFVSIMSFKWRKMTSSSAPLMRRLFNTRSEENPSFKEELIFSK